MKGSRLQTRSLLSQSKAIPVNVCAWNMLAFMAQQKHMHQFSADRDVAMLSDVDHSSGPSRTFQRLSIVNF
jgi:hypothetical protein